MIQSRYYKENLDAGHFEGLKGKTLVEYCCLLCSADYLIVYFAY